MGYKKKIRDLSKKVSSTQDKDVRSVLHHLIGYYSYGGKDEKAIFARDLFLKRLDQFLSLYPQSDQIRRINEQSE